MTSYEFSQLKQGDFVVRNEHRSNTNFNSIKVEIASIYKGVCFCIDNSNNNCQPLSTTYKEMLDNYCLSYYDNSRR